MQCFVDALHLERMLYSEHLHGLVGEGTYSNLTPSGRESPTLRGAIVIESEIGMD